MDATAEKQEDEKQFKGLILPVATKSNELILANRSIELNKNTNGQLLAQLNIGKPLKKDQTRILWNLSDVYPAICVVGTGDLSEQGKNKHLELFDHVKEATRRAVGLGTQALASHGVLNVNFEDFDDVEAAVEGATLAAWKFQQFKDKTKHKPIPIIEKPGAIQGVTNVDEQFQRGLIKAKCQNFTRELMEIPSNHLTPEKFAERVVNEFKNTKVKVTAHDRKWIEKQKMGSFLSVANGSDQPPVFLEIHYSNGGNSKPYVFVGKGVTFDSGGISIKSSANMDAMRADMGGAACVVSTIKGASELNLPVNLIGLIPLTENMPSGKATKPGDIVFARNGKSICIDNTDAEGRLILADGLCYSKEFNPAWVVDIATLTGAMHVALGDSATGVFSNSDQLWKQLADAGAVTGDRVWRMPLWEHFTSLITKSDSYDLNNISGVTGAGACSAAVFLREFVPENTEWMHLDIAGVMDGDGGASYLSKGMSGRPTRTLIQFLQQLSKN